MEIDLTQDPTITPSQRGPQTGNKPCLVTLSRQVSVGLRQKISLVLRLGWTLFTFNCSPETFPPCSDPSLSPMQHVGFDLYSWTGVSQLLTPQCPGCNPHTQTPGLPVSSKVEETHSAAAV